MTINTYTPKANRVRQEEYLTYDYPNLTLYEDFSDGMARKTKYFLVLKGKTKRNVYLKRGTQEHNLNYIVDDFPPLEGQRFTSPFNAAKAVDEILGRVE